MEYRTYDEWKALGYNVKKGSKSTKRVEGKAVFSKDQVKVKEYYYGDDSYEDDEQIADYISDIGDR